ncbi:type VII secretion protein EccCa [Solwaraspora sp. WMMD1047]|uniref:type VII secretion protein EccCa n=1 Tax=Solwaraspora sp. WMMD1047 TaxID=3016102 RepID=UPI002416ACEA|nr:type VII secretion protein EccCa [Solwaraspora sp. WMMD1047]MDG4831846.1 type VII secretion protein EccCa [Solwaraspora sp. WMMD1047]
MAIVVVRRQPRQPAPELPAGELLLEAPPAIPPPAGRQWTQFLGILPLFAVMAVMLVVFSGSLSSTVRLVIFAVLGVVVIGVVVFALLGGGGAGRREMAYARRLYLRGLAQRRIRLRRAIGRQRAALQYLHPEPDALWSLVGSYRLWERRPDDADFAVTRIGVGPQAPAMTLVPPDTQPMEQLEPLSALALRRFVRAYHAVADLPLALPLTGFARLYLRGPRTGTVPLARAMLAQLATLHAPDDLRIAVCVANQRRADWDWVKWLPHALHPDRTDAAGPVRLVTADLQDLEELLAESLTSRPRFDPDGRRATGPQLVVVIDGGDRTGSEHLASPGGVEGVLVIDLTATPPRALGRLAVVLELDADGTLTAATRDGATRLGRADALDATTAEALARQLAPLRLTGGDPGLTTDLTLAELLDLGDPRGYHVAAGWTPRPERERLRVMFGLRPDGTPIELDLKESAQDGMGPHGLLIGATGSGKSELLRTLVLALAVTHPPSSLNFALIDFKGGATFTRLDALPHTSAVITNLAEELPLVDRTADALNGELTRRQELLRAAGGFSSLRDYERARAAGADLPEVPTLLVICDEFSELLSQKQEFIETFVQIGRLGRSLGVHLLLASQRLEEGRLRGLDAHLSYRIGLRTFSAADSRTVLGVTDAFQLPRAPGHGFLTYGAEPPIRFRAAYVSGTHRGPAGDDPAEAGGVRLLSYTTEQLPPGPAATPSGPDPGTDPEPDGDSLLDILVERLIGQGSPAHQIWLPPLGEPPTLDQLLGPPGSGPGRAPAGRLRVPVGIVDRPLEQRRDLLEFDLSAGAGHLAVVGGPRSGKSTALRTVIAGLALTHSARQVQFYCLDLGGGGLAALRGLPHLGGVAGRQNAGAVKRTVAQLTALLAERERRFAEHEVDGISGYRAARDRGEFADDPYGDVFLVVDGWQTLRKDFEQVETAVADLVARGLGYGIHLLVACSRWMDLRPAVRDMFGSRIELRLAESIDSAIDRAAAARVPKDAPGRGITAGGQQMLLALPRADGIARTADLTDAVTALAAGVSAGWAGRRAPGVRLLPAVVADADLPAPTAAAGDGLRVSIGIGEQDLAPVELDFDADPHLLLLGDTRSGKTGFLRLLARRIAVAQPPGRARFVVIDHRRSLLGELPAEHLLGHGTDPDSSRRLIHETARAIAERVPGPDVTTEQVRRRSWWRGPELFLLVDDYDLVIGPGDNPFQPLLGYLPRGHELGLHVVVTRRSGGAGRALYETFLARLRDVGSPGLQLAGSRDEGPLLGGLKAEPLPPGRGRLISRGQPAQLLQLAWLPPTG